MKSNKTIYDHIYEGMHPNHLEVKGDVWAIGDVHGCAREFELMCEKIHESSDSPTIIQLGDLIDRGPDFLEVFDIVEKYDVITIIGNHEMNFLLEVEGYKQCRSRPRKQSHEEFLSLSEEDQDHVLHILKRSKNYLTFTNKQADFIMLSHAPIKGLGMSEVISLDNGNGWLYCSNNQPYDRLSALEVGVHGHQHWNYRDIDDQIIDFKDEKQSWFNIDGGCVYGDDLIGLNLETYEAIKVKSEFRFT